MDPIADMLIKLKNANRAEHETVSVPFSQIKLAILECLVNEGYIKSVTKKTEKTHPTLEAELAYRDGSPRISDVSRISKPSRRMYMGAKDIRPIKNGFGVIVLSTPKGIMSGVKAKKELVGGEVLFKMW